MRKIMFVVAVVMLALPTGVGSQQKGKTDHLNGKWKCVRVEMKDGVKPKDAGWVMTIAGNQVSWVANNGQSAGPYPITIDPDAKPPRMDFSGVGIYCFNGDMLVFCWWSQATDRQATFDLPKHTSPGRIYTFLRMKE